MKTNVCRFSCPSPVVRSTPPPSVDGHSSLQAHSEGIEAAGSRVRHSINSPSPGFRYLPVRGRETNNAWRLSYLWLVIPCAEFRILSSTAVLLLNHIQKVRDWIDAFGAEHDWI